MLSFTKDYIQISLRTDLTINIKTTSWKRGVKQSKTKAF